MDKKELFFQTALQLIHKKGFKAMTLRDLAHDLACDVSNIYNYVPNKQAILEYFLFDISDRFLSFITTLSRSNLSGKAKVEAIVSHYVKITVQFPYQVALLSHDWKQLKEPRLSEFLAEKKQFEKAVSDILEQAQKEGFVKEIPLPILSHVFLSTLRWLFDWYLENKETVNPFELESYLHDLITDGIFSTQ